MVESGSPRSVFSVTMTSLSSIFDPSVRRPRGPDRKPFFRHSENDAKKTLVLPLDSPSFSSRPTPQRIRLPGRLSEDSPFHKTNEFMSSMLPCRCSWYCDRYRGWLLAPSCVLRHDTGPARSYPTMPATNIPITAVPARCGQRSCLSPCWAPRAITMPRGPVPMWDSEHDSYILIVSWLSSRVRAVYFRSFAGYVLPSSPSPLGDRPSSLV